MKYSNLSMLTILRLQCLGGIVDENINEPDFVRVWFDGELMTISRNGELWTLTYRGETTISPENEIGLAVRFLLNYTMKHHVDSTS